MLPQFNSPLDVFKIMFNLGTRYLIFTGSFYLLFYVLLRRKFWYAKIQQRYPENKYILREIVNSVITIFIFGVIILLVIGAGKYGFTRVYTPIDKYGYPYFYFSIVLMIIIHDTYFYWTHRLMHWKPLFKIAHKTHHLSTNPTPFAAYAFHPIEAVIEIGIVPVVAFTIPHHPLAIGMFSLYSLLLNVTGHLGYEIFPKGFARHWLFKWHNTSTHHNMHHRLVKCNYGLYFNFWDRLMKTNHPQYEENFEAIVANRKSGNSESNRDTLNNSIDFPLRKAAE